MKYEIQHGVPIPKKGMGRPRNALSLAIGRLNVGDSMLVESAEKAHAAAHNLGVSITTRKMDGQTMIWRTA